MFSVDAVEQAEQLQVLLCCKDRYGSGRYLLPPCTAIGEWKEVYVLDDMPKVSAYLAKMADRFLKETEKSVDTFNT